MPDPAAAPYRVLARKYRPTNFAELIGQEALVRTLTNAIRQGRVAHAFMLTGVRGVGKTTTARIIARALNCVGPDGKGGPTAEPCGVCEHCRAIAEDRHVDVIEMDAASRTGVADIRDLIDGVQYRPVRARTKIYIVDEVHMLSTPAFNALLKTLEEPPEHVKFVFATTEIRKVPVTVLSRCQRFDLRRLDRERLAGHLADLAAKEGASVAPEAVALIARAADGSVRDGLSLLDRALAEAEGGGAVDAEAVRAMLGLADRAATLDLFERIVGGRTKEALDQVAALYRAGADPLALLHDLLDIVHWLTRQKLVPETAAEAASAAERVRGERLAGALSIAALSRAWQMMLKGIGELQHTPAPIDALEMLVVRLCHVADMPTPGDIVARLASGNGAAALAATPPPGAAAPSGHGGARAVVPSPAVASPAIARTPGAGGAGLAPRAAAAPAADPVADPVAEPVADPADFAGLVRLFRDRREVVVASQLETSVHVVRFEPGRFEFRPGPSAPTDLAQRVGRLLGAWTGRRWVVAVSGEVGQPTLKESTNAADRADRDRAAENALVKAALAAFPGAAVTAVRKLGGAAPALSPAADSEAEDGALGEAPPVEAYDLDEELA